MARQPKPWYRKDRKIWCATINGQRHTLGRTKKEALARFSQLLNEPRQTTVVGMPMAPIIDRFLDWTDRNRSAATYEWYRQRLQRFVDHYPKLLTSELRPWHVEEWAASSPRSINTRRNLMRSVKRCLKWAHSQGYIDQNPIAYLEIPSASPKEIYVSESEFKTLLSFVHNDPFRDLLEVTYEVGCRPQESLRLETRHVDLAYRRWVIPASEAKGKQAPRIVYLTDKAFDVTSHHLTTQPNDHVFRNSSNQPWKPYSVGCQFSRLQIRMAKARMKERGETITKRDIANFIPSLSQHRTSLGQTITKTEAELRGEAKRKLTERYARQVIPRYSLYSLRHSWATNALKRGIDPLTVAILMGHKDPSTLARTYQHLSHNPEHMLAQAQQAAG